VKHTRGLWLSIAFVAFLVVTSLTGFATGSLKPKLGLDLEGGLSVILQAPAGTSLNVMNQALDNIRNRVDAFGVGEPQIAVSQNTIEVQIPGAANGTVQKQAKDQYCLIGKGQTNYGCANTQGDAQKALDNVKVLPEATKVCLEDTSGKQLACYGTKSDALTQLAAITIGPPSATPSATPSASASASVAPSASPAASTGQFCLTDSNGTQLGCYPSKKSAQAVQKALVPKSTAFQYCVVAPATVAGKTPASPSHSATPTPTPTTSTHATKPSSSATPSPSPSPSPVPSPYSQLTFDGNAVNLSTKATCQPSKTVAQSTLQGITVTHETTQYCVISSGGKNKGCYLTQQAAKTQQQATGQDALLAVIGKTARLEQRPVLSIISPGQPTYATTSVTCPTTAQQATKQCSTDALKNQTVVYLGTDGTTKYQLGPVVLTGDQVSGATAVLNTGSTSSVGGWEINFTLNSAGSKAFADATTAAVSQTAPRNEIAIVVDRQVISSPVVQSAITGGSGVITGSFSEQDAKNLATELKAGALPVDLTLQSVTTISPTLGSQSLREGIIAGVAGLLLLFAYMLFYYRLLGVVAIMGMSIWAILAIALVSVAGSSFGYAMTLAGVAGLVISLGVTTDSYIVFFERLKDEVRNGRSPRSAVQPAFKRAYRTIVAADSITGIAAAVLYLTAVSSVRGFALTLGVATLLDLFVVWFFKRPTVFLIARNTRLVELKGFGLSSGVAADLEPGEVPLPAGGEA
jgi:preprotein translocase subunit SecD